MTTHDEVRSFEGAMAALHAATVAACRGRLACQICPGVDWDRAARVVLARMIWPFDADEWQAEVDRVGAEIDRSEDDEWLLPGYVAARDAGY